MRSRILSGSARWRAVRLLAVGHMKEFLREPGAVFWALGFPILLSTALGLAFLTPKSAKTVLVTPIASGEDSATAMDRVMAALPSTKAVSIEAAGLEECRRRIRRGEAVGLLYAPPGRPLVLEVDTGSQEGQLARLLVERALRPTTSNVLQWRSPSTTGGRYADYLFPGMLALGLMNGAVWGVGFSLMDLRLRKLLRLFAATPLRRSDILGSVVLSRLFLMPFENTLLWGFGMLVFGVRVHGSWPAFLLAAFAGSLTFSGIGVLGASRVSQPQAAYGIINALTIPMTIVSGVFFAWKSFPHWLHPVLEYLPLTLLADSLRALSSEGADFATAAPKLAILLAWAVVTWGVGLRLFRWR